MWCPHFRQHYKCCCRVASSLTGQGTLKKVSVSPNKYFNPLALCGARPLITYHDAVVVGISIHLPRAGRDQLNEVKASLIIAFQFTRPVRGETLIESKHNSILRISIHSPRAGRDKYVVAGSALVNEFQPTRPARGETQVFTLPYVVHVISIHSPRVGRGAGVEHQEMLRQNFNPLAPCGARPDEQAVQFA